MTAEPVWYFDTGVFVTPLLRNHSDAVVASCLDWQQRAAAGAITVVTSALTWDEVTWVAGRRRATAFDFTAAALVGKRLRTLPGLSWAAVDEKVLDLAGRLLAEARLRPRDAIHAATALMHANGRLLTLDGDFPHGQILPDRPPLTVVRLLDLAAT